MTNEKLLRVPEVANQLEVKESTIRRWILLRRIEYVRVSARAIRIRQRVVDDIISSGTVAERK